MELKELHAMVDKGIGILGGRAPLEEFGKLLHKNWMLKRALSDDISNVTIDEIYKKALDNGAIGGKLSGAGGSGFMLFFVPISKQANFLSAMKPYICVPFSFTQSGSSIIYYDESHQGINGRFTFGGEGSPKEFPNTDFTHSKTRKKQKKKFLWEIEPKRVEMCQWLLPIFHKFLRPKMSFRVRGFMSMRKNGRTFLTWTKSLSIGLKAQMAYWFWRSPMMETLF